VQVVIDGHKAVIGYHSQKELVQHKKITQKRNLVNAAFTSYGLSVCLDIHRCLWELVVEVKQISTKDRLDRKKYMGVCR
jgi:hypothetical protein